MANYMGLISLGMRLLEDERKSREDRAKLSVDLDAQDKMVAKFAGALSPKKEKAKGKYILETDAIDAMIPGDHPMKGFGPQLRRDFQKALADPRYSRMHPAEILQGLGTKAYALPSPEGHPSVHRESQRYKYEADTSWFGGIDQEDESIRKPIFYDKYRAEMEGKARELIEEDKFSVGGYLKHIAGAGAGGFIAGGAVGMLPFGPPGAAATGTVWGGGAAFAEAVTYPIKRLAMNIPGLRERVARWQVAKMHSPSTIDKYVKPMLATAAIDIYPWTVGEKLVGRLLTIPTMATSRALALPTAKNILGMSQAKEGLNKAFVDRASREHILNTLGREVVEGRRVGKGYQDMAEMIGVLKGSIPILGRRRYGGVADPRRYIFDYEVNALTHGQLGEVGRIPPGLGKTPTGGKGAKASIKWEPGIGMAEEAPIYHHFRQLDEVALEEAFNAPGGPLAGAKKAANRQAKRELATGVASIDDTLGAITRIQNRSRITLDKIKGGAVKDLNDELRKIDVLVAEGIATTTTPTQAKGIYELGETAKTGAREFHRQVATAKSLGLNTPGIAKDTLTGTTTETSAEAIVNQFPSVPASSSMAKSSVMVAGDVVDSGQSSLTVNKVLHAMQGGQLDEVALGQYHAISQRLIAKDPGRLAGGEFNRLRAVNFELEQAVSLGQLTPEEAYSKFSRAWLDFSTAKMEAMGTRPPAGAETVPLRTGRVAHVPGQPQPVGVRPDVEPPTPPIKPAVSTEPIASKATAVTGPEGRRLYVRDTYTDTLKKMSEEELAAEASRYREIVEFPAGSTAEERGAAQRIIQEIDRRKYVEPTGEIGLPEVKYEVDVSGTTSPAQIMKDMEGMTANQTWHVTEMMEAKLQQKYWPHREYAKRGAGEAGEMYVSRTTEEMETLGSLLNKEEYAAREAALSAHDKARIREGATPLDKVPHMKSPEHLEQVQARHQTTKGGHYAASSGFRQASEVEMTARLKAKRAPTPEEVEKIAKLEAIGKKLDKELAGKHAPFHDYDRAVQEVQDISDLYKAGKLTAEEALERASYLDEAVHAGRMHLVDKASFLESMGPVLSQLRKMTALTAFFAMLGVGPEVFNLFSGGDFGTATAEAGMLMQGVKTGAKAFTRGILTAEREVLLNKALKAGYITELIEDPRKYVMMASEFMRGLPGDNKLGGPMTVLRSINKYAKKGVKPGLRHAIMSPYQKFDEALEIGRYIMNNPAVFRAHYQVGEYHNIRNINTVLTNIFREAKAIENPVEIARHFDHLVPLMERQVAYEFHADRLLADPKQWKGEKDFLFKQIRDKKASMTKANKAVIEIDIANLEKEVAYSQAQVKELGGAIGEYHTEWAKTAELAARQDPSVRVYLSLWDGPDFAKAPFMKNISLSPDEQVLVGRLREQLLHYKYRMDERGVDTITGPYAPVMLHPNFGADKFTEISGHEKAAAYMKFYRRTPGSRPLFPATETTMRRYVSDTERRIMNKDFWDSGWKEVQTRTRDFPLLAQAFQALEEGVRPIEMTWGNKLANMYVQFEAYKRLWFNPSAGGKHLIKQTSNWATTGFGESFYAYPESYKHLAKRSMDLTKTTRSVMSRGGVTGRKDQDKLVNAFLHSVIPARNARQRLLDMGINTNDLYFSAGKEMMHRSQNAGAVWINMAEVFDRGVSGIAGINMASKRGLTAEQSMYGVMDLILKNNFLSRELNPGWMRNPKIRALLMFQGTPFKIAERRVVQAFRSGRAIKRGYRGLKEASKTAEGRAKLMSDFRDLRYLMKTSEREFKANLFIDALNSEVDFFGTPIVNQFAKDIAIIAGASMGGAHWGMNLNHHFFHVPFFSGMTHDPVISLSPGPMNAYRTWKTDVDRSYADDDWMFNKVMEKWLGPTWIAPDILWKADRLSRNDIPDLYKGSEFQYIFAIPAKHK